MGGEGRVGWDEYSTRWAALHGGVDPRRSTPLVRFWLRFAFLVGRVLVALRIRPGVVTAAGILLAMSVSAVAIFRGVGLFAAAGLVALSALADSADGAAAVLAQRTSRLGAFQDSVADRISEAGWLVGLWLIGVPGILVSACGGLAWLHEYMRARAAAVGMRGIGTITVAERPTRAIVAAAAFLLGGVAWLIDPRLTPGAATVVLAIWGVLGLLGAVKLYGAVRAGLAR